MIKTLRFVQGAVAKKDFHPALTHFRIRNGQVIGYNGQLAISSPIQLNLDVTPNATQLLKTLNACQDTIAIHQTPSGRLSIKSGSFKAFVDCTVEDFPEVVPTGERFPVPKDFLKIIKTLYPLTAMDASRPWAQGILFRGRSAFATNNVVLVEYWVGSQTPVEINIPKTVVNELLRIGEEPESLQVSQNACTFHYPENRWVYSLLYDHNWPDFSRILDAENNPKPVPAGLWEALKKLLPFINDFEDVYFEPGLVTTDLEDGVGAVVELSSLTQVPSACFNIKHFLLLEPIVQEFDFSTYPMPCMFFGPNIRGAILGKRR